MKTTLIYIRPWRKSTGLRVDVRVGDGPVGDSFGQGGFEWEPAITVRPVISQELMSIDLDGKVQAGRATFTLKISSILSVSDILKLDWQGAPVDIWTVDELGWAERALEITGNVSAARPDLEADTIQVTVEGNIQLIEKPLLTLAFSGGGLINGDAAKQGLLRPAGFGIVEYVEPVWFDETYNIGQLDGYGNLVSIQKVMEGANDYGAPVANYASYALLRAAIIAKTVAPGRYGTCIAEGLIGFGAPPVGVIGVNCTFGYELPGTFAQRIVEFHAGVALGSIDNASFTALTAQVAAVVGGTPNVGKWFGEQRQVRDLLEAICGSCNATPLVTLQGKVAVTRGVASAAVATLNRNGSVDPRVIQWRAADTVAPVYQLKARTAQLGRVLNRDEVFGEDKFTPMGVWNVLIGYRLYNTVLGPDGAEWLYINAVPTIGPALPTATYPPAAFASNAYWQQITRPVPLTGSQIGVADGATANVTLVSIGSQAATIVGNSFSRAAGGADYNCCVRASPLLGTHYAEVDIIAGANFTVISLDDDATSTTQAAMLVTFYYRASDGAWNLNYNNVSVGSGTTTTGLAGKLRLSYDGIRYRAYINAAQMGTDQAASASNLVLWPKWHAYNGPNVAVTGVASGPFTSNIWPDISGANRPADNATADLKLTSIGSTGVTIIGNTVLRTSGTGDYNATVRAEPISYAIYAEVDIAAVNALTVVGLDTAAAGTAATTAWRIYAGYNYSTGQLDVIRAGVSVLSSNIGASIAGKLILAYDGVKYRVWVGGVERTITGSSAETAGLSLWPKWSSYTSAVTMTGLLAAPFTNNDFGTIGGPTVPAPNATADLVLVAIGTQVMTLVGNTLRKTAGGAAYNGGAAASSPIIGAQFVEADIYPGNAFTMVGLDTNLADYTFATNLLACAYYNSATGAWFIGSDAVNWGSGTTTTGLTGKVRLEYDGLYYKLYIGGTLYGPATNPASAPDLKLWAKWIAYDQLVTFTGAAAGAMTNNAWAPTGGPGRPADNSGTVGNFTNIGSTATTVVGNSGKRNSGSADRNATVRGDPVQGAQYIEMDISPGGITIVNLDDDATAFAYGSMLVTADYRFSDGAWNVSTNGAAVSGTTTAGLSGRIRIIYDGVRFRCYINQIQIAADIAASGGALTLWPKWSFYEATGVTYTGLRSGPFTSNYWTDVGGAGVPSDNAGTSVTFTSSGAGASSVVIRGNYLLRASGGGAWDARVWSREVQTNTGSWQFKMPASSASSLNMMVLLLETPAAGFTNSYDTGLGVYWVASTGVYGWDNAGFLTGFASPVSNTLNDVWTFEYDGNTVRIYQNTTLRGSKVVGPGKSYSFAFCPLHTGAWVSDAILGRGPDRYLDSLADGATYGRTQLTELTGGLLRLTQAGGGRRLGDTRNMPNIAALNLGYKWTGAITYTSASGTPATGTINVAAGSTTSGITINYNAMSVGVTGTNGTSTQFYLYVNDPTNAGGAQTLIATATPLTVYSGSGYVYVGDCLVVFPALGSGGGGGGGGGGVCVGADEWVETFDRGFVPAREIRRGDVVRVLTDDREAVAWEHVTANKLGWDNSWLITSRSGVEVLVSWSTPITLRDGSLIAVRDVDGQELPIFVDELAWEPCWARFIGMNQVAKIECRQKTYAAGRIAGRSILTHNPKP